MSRSKKRDPFTHTRTAYAIVIYFTEKTVRYYTRGKDVVLYDRHASAVAQVKHIKNLWAENDMPNFRTEIVKVTCTTTPA